MYNSFINRVSPHNSYSGNSKHCNCKYVNYSIFFSFLFCVSVLNLFYPNNLKSTDAQKPDAHLMSLIPSAITETWTTWNK